MRGKIMIDASMILHRDSLDQLIQLFELDPVSEIVISDAFVRMLEVSFSETKMLEDVLFSLLSKHFEIEEHLINRNSIRHFLFSEKYSKKIIRYCNEKSYKHNKFQNLINMVDNEWITQILFEEWEFLTTNFWLVSKLRTVFDKIVESGGTALYISQNEFEVLVRKILKKKKGKLSPNDKITGIAKWVAFGKFVLPEHDSSITSSLTNSTQRVFLFSSLNIY